MIAAHEIVERALAPASIVLNCPDAAYLQKLLPGVSVVLPGGSHADAVDILIYGGGTQFYSFPQTSERGFRLLRSRLVRGAKAPLQAARRLVRRAARTCNPSLHPRTAAIGIGLGPFLEDCPHVRRVRDLFVRMDYVGARDTATYTLCREWGCQHVSLVSDMCFLPGLWPMPPVFPSMAKSTSAIQRVGIIVRDWRHTCEGASYTEPLLKVVEALRQGGREVTFISFQPSSDYEWLQRLSGRGEVPLVWDPGKSDIPSFLEQLSEYDAFIAARYHGAVFASILRKPSICIEVEQKLALVAGLLGAGARLWAQPFDVDQCLDHVENLHCSYSAAVSQLDGVVAGQGALARQMADELRVCLAADRA
jgi:polysaccharide pyruvyl transferase WcaK-like protein